MSQPKPEGDDPTVQTPEGHVEQKGLTGLPIEDQAVQDILFETMVQKPEEKKDEVTPPVEEKPAEVVPPVEEKKEDKPADTTTPPAEQYFAKLGDQEFKTKDDLVAFAQSQNGFNRSVVGNLKKIHPEWFDEKGTLKPDRMRQVKEAAPAAKVEDAPAVLNETDKDKLRALGIVFQEDIKGLQDAAQRDEDAELATWLGAHPKAGEYMEEISALVDATSKLPEEQQLDPDQAWSVVQNRHQITPETPQSKTYEQGLEDGKKKAGLDNAGSSPPGKPGTGEAPKVVQGSIIDEALASNHW